MGVGQMVSMFLVLLAVAPTTAAPSSTITAATTPASTTTMPASTTTTTTTTTPATTTPATTTPASTTTTTPAPLKITVVLVFEDRYIITYKVLDTNMENLENTFEDLFNERFTDKYDDGFSHCFVDLRPSSSTRAEGTLTVEFNSETTTANLPSKEAIAQTVVDVLRDPNNALNIEPNSVTLAIKTAAPPTTATPASTTTPASLKITVVLIFEDHCILTCKVLDTDMEILENTLEDLFNERLTDKYEDKFSHCDVDLRPSNSTRAEGTLAVELNSDSTTANLPSKEAIAQTIVDVLRDPDNALNIEPNSVTLAVPATAPPTTAA